MVATVVIETVEIPIITREYFRIPVEIKVNNVSVDPTTDAVEFALPLTTVRPLAGDWKAGTWETTLDDRGQTIYLARAFVGDATTDFTLADGTTYDVWWRVTDAPERPARLVARIKGV